MSKINFFLLLISVLVFSSCETEYKFQFDSPKKIHINEVLKVSAKEINGQKMDKIIYSLDGKSIKNPSEIDITAIRLGKHVLSAILFYGHKKEKLTNTITFLAAKNYDIYDFKLINTYPHDATAYTQGLEFHNGFLYESTGRKGKSSLRKVALKTGKVIQKIEVPAEYFAEGMTIYQDKIYQLTWQSKKGFVYNLKDFKQLKVFDYEQSLEGWGLASDGTKIFKTDGSEKIWFLNPETLKETGFIEVYTNKSELKELNELEFVEGKIYANVWMKNVISIINPKNGTVEGVADLKELVEEMKKEQYLQHDDVLNGIAYDKKGKRLFVTGKHWSKLFEIELVKRP